MKQLTKQLKDFILAFDLADSLTRVCFDAMVFYYSDILVMEVESQIHIITILPKNLDVLYIINHQIREKAFPHMFQSTNCRFDFKEKKGLLIKEFGREKINYSILIQPTGKNCEPATLEEIKAEMSN